MITIYTLKSCDTCKKALRWLDENGIAYRNHDVRTDGLNADTIKEIVEAVGWEKALNRRSTTWRNLTDADKTGVDNVKATDLILQHPTLMKRPVFVKKPNIHTGFDDIARKILKS